MAVSHSFGTLPVVDVAPLVTPEPARLAKVARQIEAACREHGFFYVTGHGVPPELPARLAAACAAFFELPPAAKMEIAMARGGLAWRGYFPVGAELTSGQPDLKEGLYFGAELGDEDPGVRAGLPLHGRNLFPRQVPELRAAVLAYIDALTGVGQAVMRGVALSRPRWDGQNLHAFTGTYGDYLLSKVSKVFPELRREVLADEAP
jgi:isopenicillin N synthase-like dioxygenase